MNTPPRATLGWMQNPVRGLLHGASALLSVVGAAALWSRADGEEKTGPGGPGSTRRQKIPSLGTREEAALSILLGPGVAAG
jgi:hypothetical protein